MRYTAPMVSRTHLSFVLLFGLTGCGGTFIPVKVPATTTVAPADTADVGGDDGGTTDTDSGGDDGTTDSGGDDGGGDDSGGDDGGGDDGGGDDGTDTNPESILGSEAPDFSLEDLNDTSPTFGQTISPADLIAQTSGWYFTHAT